MGSQFFILTGQLFLVGVASEYIDAATYSVRRNCYYGEHWAGLMHRELTQWLEDHRSESVGGPDVPAPGDNCISLRASLLSSVSNICEIIHEHVCPETQQQDNACPETGGDDVTLTSEVVTTEQSATDQSTTAQGCQHTTWQSLESLRRRFTHDIVPKVSIEVI